ncbi:RNA-binding S4 domain-containing protein [Vallicoccus soli]|uniref:RNA-binding S4 domain-containing protein n=1 Tax=Vallicoccus soli TaxID=2339232 RepID=UPI001C49ADD4|nr:RNA-binding S4 domain-containing protein [Vallicoccus soli]
MDEIAVDERGIRLGQLLKVWGAVDTGGEVKALLEAGEVQVNGRPARGRGAQLRVGDVVAHGGRRVRLVAAPG